MSALIDGAADSDSRVDETDRRMLLALLAALALAAAVVAPRLRSPRLEPPF